MGASTAGGVNSDFSFQQFVKLQCSRNIALLVQFCSVLLYYLIIDSVLNAVCMYMHEKHVALVKSSR